MNDIYTNPIHFTTIWCFIRKKRRIFFLNSILPLTSNTMLVWFENFHSRPEVWGLSVQIKIQITCYIVNVIYMYWEPHDWYHKAFNPLRMKTTLYLFLRGNKSLLYHQIGNRNFFIFITIQWNLMFCQLLCRQDKIWTFGNPFQSKKLPICTRIVIFNLCICCQFEDSQIISPKIKFLWAIATFNYDKWGLIFCSIFFSFFWYIIQNF